MIISPQKFVNSCWLACISYIVGIPEEQLLQENPDILTVEKLNFIWLYTSEICILLQKYWYEYMWWEYSMDFYDRLNLEGTIVYIEQIDHYLVRLSLWWWDPYRNLKWIPVFWYWNELPYDPSYIIFPQRYH